MSQFVKKVGNQEFYEIDGIRAAGIIPYYIENNEVKIFILIINHIYIFKIQTLIRSI